MNVKDRILEYLEFKGISINKAESTLGWSKGALLKANSISSDRLREFILQFPEISSEWILTGKGSMLKYDNGLVIQTEEDYNSAISKDVTLLPEVDFKFAAGQKQLINNTENISRYWYLPDCKDCEGVAQVIGQSMSPTLPSGSWVALKRYSLPNNSNMIPFGNIFGIVIEDELTGDYTGHLKILRRYKDEERAKKYWIAHSINFEEFDDFDIEIQQVRGLWIVKQHIVSDIL